MNQSRTHSRNSLLSELPRLRQALFAAGMTLLLALPASASLSRPDPSLFPVPANLEANVDFWVDIFSRYTSQEAVLHDEGYVGVVYAVLDFSKVESSFLSDAQKRRRREEADERAKKKYELILRDLAAGKPPATDDARRVEALFASIPGGNEKYAEAIDRLRTQRGLKDRFETALARAGRYMPAIEEIFTARDLPLTLTRMPFVESMFQEGARSKKAAGGIWQIMPSTGRGMLRIDAEVDERFDPLKASVAAARLLEQNYKRLGTWPLAITGYNHGANGMARAVRTLGTQDFGVIVERHQSRIFGFASKNFYAEVLAAAILYDNRDHYFPGITPEPALTFDEIRPDRYVSPVELARRTGTPVDALKDLNPALASGIWRGEILSPKDYSLRVPPGSSASFQTAYAELPDKLKPGHQIGQRYRVRKGDTLGAIARRFGTTVSALQRANGLRRANLIRVGQTLRIPAPGSRASAPSRPRVHVVRQGDNLTAIAKRYGTSVPALRRANKLSSSNRIYPGQRLTIPG